MSSGGSVESDSADEDITQKSKGDEDRAGTALDCLKLLLNFHQIPAEIEQLRHAIGGTNQTAIDLVRLAKQLGAKARLISVALDRLERQPLPAIAAIADGSFVIVGRVQDGKVLIHAPSGGQSGILSLDEFAELWLGAERVTGTKGELLLLTTREALAGRARRFDVSWFIPALVKYRNLLGQVLLASLVIQILALGSPLLFQLIIDKVLVHQTISTLDMLFIGFLLLAAGEYAMGVGRTWLFSHTTSRVDVELGSRLYRHLLGLPMAYFGARRVGDSVARVRELETIREFLTSSSVTVVLDVLFATVFLAVMYVYSPALLLVVLLTLPVYVGILWALSPVLKRRLDEKFSRGAENQAFLVESVTNVETAKAMAVEPALQARWERQMAGYVQAGFKARQIANWGSESIQLVSKLSSAIILYMGARRVMGGDMTVGELVAFTMFASRVSGPVLRLAQMVQDFAQVKIAVERLGDILNTPTEPSSSPSRAALPAIKGAVEFEHLTFRYRPDAAEVLKDICLKVPPGQMLGIVGPSGSGKSTLTKLVQRLHVPESGRVMVDGVDLAQVDPSWLRRQIGVVLQENRLFNRSIRENIALANPAMPLEAVVEAATLAGAHEFIVRLPQGYDTVVEERGANLSGGQRQRLAIARALVTRPRILILDEATSALDAESEEIIQNNLKAMSAGRTVLIIAHRLSAVRQCDHLIALEAGRIVERGSHDELLRAGGRYADLHRRQTGLAMAGLAPVENPA